MKINVTYVPKASDLADILASDDPDELKKIRTKGLVLTAFSNSLHKADGNMTTLVHDFLNTIEEL